MRLMRNWSLGKSFTGESTLSIIVDFNLTFDTRSFLPDIFIRKEKKIRMRYELIAAIHLKSLRSPSEIRFARVILVTIRVDPLTLAP